MKIKYILPLLLLPLAMCEEPFMPGKKEYDRALVVEGMITNQPGPYTIRLSQTTPLGTDSISPLTGCNVALEEKAGPKHLLSETQPGVYQSAKKGIRGKVGHSYRLLIETPKGKTYQSDFIRMKPTVGIDSVYHRIEHHTSQNYPNGLPGYQFYLNTKKAVHDSTFFFWKLVETYEYTADFKIKGIFTNYQIQPFYNYDTLYRCWNTQRVKEIFTARTSSLDQAQLNGHPLHFVGTDNKRLSIRYSLKVNQYTVNEATYQYWDAIKEQISQKEFLFSKQPYQIRGNIYSPDNPQELVRGYFTVASVKQDRIYVERPSLEFIYPRCVLDFELGGLYYLPSSAWPVFLGKLGNSYGRANPECFDCRMEGGSLEKPDFWKD